MDVNIFRQMYQIFIILFFEIVKIGIDLVKIYLTVSSLLVICFIFDDL